MATATLERTEQNKYRCGHCRKYHSSQAEIRECGSVVNDGGGKGRTVRKVPAKRVSGKPVSANVVPALTKPGDKRPWTPPGTHIVLKNPLKTHAGNILAEAGTYKVVKAEEYIGYADTPPDRIRQAVTIYSTTYFGDRESNVSFSPRKTDKFVTLATAVPKNPNIDQIGKQNPSVSKTPDPIDVALDLVEKPGDDAEDFSWQIISGIAAGAYDVNLDELDQAITDRLLALGYSFVDDTQPLRKKHAEAKAGTTSTTSTAPTPSEAPQTPRKPAKPKVPQVTHLDGIPVEDFVVDAAETFYHRFPKYARAKFRGGYRYYKVTSQNRKSYSAYVLFPGANGNGMAIGPDGQIKNALVQKASIEFLKLVTAETADFRKDIRAEKVDVKSALAEVKSVTAVDIDDDDDDDGPVSAVKPKVKVEKVARIATGASKAAKRRRLMRA